MYTLKTGNGVNEMMIHSARQGELTFDNIEDAKTAFEKEVECLKEAYTSFEDVDYPIEQVKESDQVRTGVTYFEDGEIKDVEELQSDYFIMD